MTTDHEAKARSIAAEFKSTVIDEAVPEYFPKLVSAIATALREAEAPLLKKIVELSAQIQRMEEINENLRSAVRDQPIKWNDEYYEMKLKEARLTEREAWQSLMKTASDMLAQMEAAGMDQEKRRVLIGCLDPQILRTDDDIAEMEAQAAAIRSTTDE